MKTRLLMKLTDKAYRDFQRRSFEVWGGVITDVGHDGICDWTEDLIGRTVGDIGDWDEDRFRCYVMKAMWDSEKDNIRERYCKYTRFSREVRKNYLKAKMWEIVLACWG